MLTLSRLYLRTDRNLQKLKKLEKIRELERIAANLMKVAAREAAKFSKVPEPRQGVVVRVRESKSVEVFVIIATTAVAFFNAVSKYPDFRNGLLMLIKDARQIGSHVRETIMRKDYTGGKKESTRITTNPMTKLKRIPERVEKGEMSRVEALEEAHQVFLRAGEDLKPNQAKILEDSIPNDATQKEKPEIERRKRRATSSVKEQVKRRYGPGVEMEKHPGSRKITKRYLS